MKHLPHVQVVLLLALLIMTVAGKGRQAAFCGCLRTRSRCEMSSLQAVKKMTDHIKVICLKRHILREVLKGSDVFVRTVSSFGLCTIYILGGDGSFCVGGCRVSEILALFP